MKKFLKILLPIFLIVFIFVISVMPCFAVTVPDIGQYVSGQVGVYNISGNYTYVSGFSLSTSYPYINGAESLITNYNSNLSASTMGLSAVYIWYHTDLGQLAFIRIPTYIGMSGSSFTYNSYIDSSYDLHISTTQSIGYVKGVCTGNPSLQSGWTISSLSMPSSLTVNINNMIWCNNYGIFNITPSSVFDKFIPYMVIPTSFLINNGEKEYEDVLYKTWGVDSFGNIVGNLQIQFQYNGNYNITRSQFDFIFDSFSFVVNGLNIKPVVSSYTFNRDSHVLQAQLSLPNSSGLSIGINDVVFKVGNTSLINHDTNASHFYIYRDTTGTISIKDQSALVQIFDDSSSLLSFVFLNLAGAMPAWIMAMILFPLAVIAAIGVIKLIQRIF